MNQLIPQDWVIGTRKHPYGDRKLGFFTYYEKNGKMNCQNSWESWSDTTNPIKFKNDPVSGWKIEDGYNSRHGQSTRKLAIIIEPRTGYKFEMDLRELVHLIQNVTIKDGVLQGKFCLTNRKSLISESEIKNMDIEDLTEKTIKIGDIVAIGKDLNRKKGMIYLGKKWITVIESKYNQQGTFSQRFEKSYLVEKQYHIFTKVEKTPGYYYGYIQEKVNIPKIVTKIGELTKKELKEELEFYIQAEADRNFTYKGRITDKPMLNPRIVLIDSPPTDKSDYFTSLWKYKGELYQGHHSRYSQMIGGDPCVLKDGSLKYDSTRSEIRIDRQQVESYHDLAVVHD
jgi:hypothetical protein